MADDLKPTIAWDVTRQVSYLRDVKGITFDKMNEDEAEVFLSQRNYFFKVKAFCKNYEKYLTEENKKGRYINLDFAHLVELSRLDKQLRSLVLDLTLDIEHYLKVRINASAMRQGVDPFSLAETFLETSSSSIVVEQAKSTDLQAAIVTFQKTASLLAIPPLSPEEAVRRANAALRELENVTQGRNPNYIRESFLAMKDSPYSKDLVSKYSHGMVPYWCLMELMSFGSVIKFYKVCFSKKGLIDDESERELLRKTKNLLRCSQVLRNAAAHNDCLLNTLSRHERGSSRTGVRKKLVEDYGLKDAELADAGTMEIAMDFAAVLMCYDLLVPEGQTRAKAGNSLASAAARFAKHKDWFSKNYHITSFLEYIETVLPLFAKKFERARDQV